jgi:DNA repair exonuclease SbcCD ATPase subunit
MSSAIEVLKSIRLEQIDMESRDPLRNAFYNARWKAIDEAVVALEKLEGLKKRLLETENRIKELKLMNNGSDPIVGAIDRLEGKADLLKELVEGLK